MGDKFEPKPYNEWGELQDSNPFGEPDETDQPRERKLEELNADFLAEEKKKTDVKRDKTNILNSIQARIEKEFHEEGNTIIYGILEDEIFPAIIQPSGDGLYASREWFNYKEHMDDFQIFKDISNADIGDIRVEIAEDMPEGLDNYAEAILDKSEGDFEDYEWSEAGGTYLMPILSEEEYQEV